MPNVHIWVRKQDYSLWQDIADKPAWLHNHLNMGVPRIEPETHSMFEEPEYKPMEPSA